MTITYSKEQMEQKLTLGNGGVWTGTDSQMVRTLNSVFAQWIGRSAYYPTPWHVAKAVADKLKGIIDEPEPGMEVGDIEDKRF